MNCRHYRSKDYAEIIDLFYTTVHTINAADYSAEELEAWAPSDKSDFFPEKKLAESYCLVVEESGKILGFANATSKDKFDCLYVDKDYQKRGVGHLLANQIEQYCKEEGAEIISVDVSLTARPFFEKRGYEILEQQIVLRHNQYLKNYKMQLKLKR
ncbi:GNAT family N-acetyltransferase [Lactococcus garvieae]|nr:GNAT family N-acetyltransferase [Lactococcus garvieae]